MEIERFAVHDGPGIRTVVFCKGCELSCPWCSNPESQSFKPILMYDRKKCVGCGTCVSVCPNGAVTLSDKHFPIFDRSKCKTCKTCVENCLQEAICINGYDINKDELIKTVLKDKDYYENSGGGVTFSGGEVFCRAKQLADVFKELKENNINIAVETCGFFPKENLDYLIDYIDLFLFDIKHIDKKKIADVIKGNCDVIFNNLEAVIKKNKPIIARIPVIPTFNYNEKDMKAILEKIKKLGITEVNLLPYHTLGKSKYDKLDIKYTMPLKMLYKEDLEPYKEMAISLGLKATIG